MDEIKLLKQRILILEKFISDLQSSHSIPLSIDQSFRARFLADIISAEAIATVPKGGTGVVTIPSGQILKGAGTSPITTVNPLSGSNNFWASNTNGGATDKQVNITDGIITSF